MIRVGMKTKVLAFVLALVAVGLAAFIAVDRWQGDSEPSSQAHPQEFHESVATRVPTPICSELTMARIRYECWLGAPEACTALKLCMNNP